MARFVVYLGVLALVLAIHNISLWNHHLQRMQRRPPGKPGPGEVVALAGDRHPPNQNAPPPPPPDLVDPYDSFSVCLLWMDDNFRMPEWIAYHYYMMNLRRLVIHTDPRSRTSPEPMLERWRNRIKIDVWGNASRFSNKTYDSYDGTDPKAEGIPISDVIRRRSRAYVERQIDFFRSCAMHLRSEGRRWVSFHDFDEFVVVTPHANVTRDDINQPGIVPRIVNRYAREALGAAAGPNRSAPLRFTDWNAWFSALPCVVLPRALFSAINSSDEDVSRDVPTFLDARRFDTFNWRHQGTAMTSRDGPGKSIIDVSRLPDDAPSREGDRVSPHRPFGQLCTHGRPRAGSMPLLIHHYVGSWEAFSYRDDVRKGLERSIEKWRDQSTWNLGGVNDEARAWIRGFVAMVGEDDAKELLRGAGLPPGAKKSDNETNDWTLKGHDVWKFW